MRVLAALFGLALAVPLVGASGSNQTAARKAPPPATAPFGCSRSTSHLADEGSLYEPLVPRKLTELPPAIAYMAVDRHIGGCEAPLTMVEYRNPRGR